MQDSSESADNQPRFGAGRFPNPTVMNAGISSTDVENEDGSYEVKNVLWSTSGFYYEFSIVIKKSIYGLVVRANVLEQTSPDTFRRTGRDVAIKVCAKDVLVRSGGVSLENPITEIGALQDVGEPRHPNIATQVECCVDDKNIYSVLKFHHGVELFDHILNNGPLDEAAARCMFQQLLLALFRLQSRDMAHRDISLENIMYNAADHSTVLIDFGLCVKLQRDPRSRGAYLLVPNAACGKSYYMPPESAWDGGLQLVNPMQGDVWSAGMCLLYALLGFPPIERACDDDVRYRYLTQGRLPELLEHWQVRLSPGLVDLIQAVLRPEPSERPSVQQILQHSWMQQDGPAYPFPSELRAEELAAACGHIATAGTCAGASSPPLSPLLHPHVAWSAVDATDSETEMDVHDGIGEETGERGEGEGEEIDIDMGMDSGLSIRSSVGSDARWSCTTTPTATSGCGGAHQAAAQSSVASRSGSFSSTCTTHLPYHSSYSSYNTSSHHQHSEGQSQHSNHNNAYLNSISSNSNNTSSTSTADGNYPTSAFSVGAGTGMGMSIDTQPCASGLSSGASSGAATPNTHPAHCHHTASGALHHAGTSVTGAGAVGVNVNTANPFGLRINTRATGSSTGSSSNDKNNNCSNNNNNNNNINSNNCSGEDASTNYRSSPSPPAVALNMANASTTFPNSTNTGAGTTSSSSNNSSGSGGGSFSGYHTRSHSFGRANINYAV